jgi:class 3 adenylate cyclase
MPEHQQRQLAAILFADIVGYTALMQHDEVLARNQLSKFREELTRQVATAKGRIVHFYGDAGSIPARLRQE